MTINNETDGTKNDSAQPNAYRADDDKDLEEKDLKRTYLFGDAKMKSTNEPGMEGQGMGGQSFGSNNLTPAGNDKDNPPQNAGESNAYFRRTQPAEEHPEDENFVVKDQEGPPGNEEQEPNVPGPQELPDQQKVGEDYGDRESHVPNPQQEYQEGTADNDGRKNPDKKA
ncbi:MAG: hypothetical protein JST19_22630 [Bacteroidetes bacterium]|nr:hypothetical protein [Bacteroidota bacterium]